PHAVAEEPRNTAVVKDAAGDLPEPGQPEVVELRAAAGFSRTPTGRTIPRPRRRRTAGRT
ncbi:MAG TPA: hypothetical protein VE440_02225, partial [Gaiellaceae bacterium]|nr:hypothetical protein [Gaiellaceae bacterium]